NRDDLGAEFPQYGRGDFVGSTVGAIDDDLQAAEIEAAGGRGLDRLDVPPIGVVEPLGAADRGGSREPDRLGCLDQRLDLNFDGIRQLEAVRPEQLDAV